MVLCGVWKHFRKGKPYTAAHVTTPVNLTKIVPTVDRYTRNKKR